MIPKVKILPAFLNPLKLMIFGALAMSIAAADELSASKKAEPQAITAAPLSNNPPSQQKTASMPDEFANVIESVTRFYDSAFNHLLQYVAGAIAIVGILLPLGNYWWQSHQLKLRERNLRDTQARLIKETEERLRNEIPKLVAGALAEGIANLEQRDKDLETRLMKRISHALGGVFHVQAKNLESGGFFGASVVSCALSAIEIIKADDEVNFKREIKVLGKLLEKCSVEDANREELKAKLDELYAAISKWNRCSAYKDEVATIKRAQLAAQNPKPDAATPKKS